MSNNPEFDRWQERFAAPGYLFGKAPNAFLQSRASLLRKGERALAVGDGEGRNGVFLAEQGLDVLSVDYSPVAQEKARALAKERGVTLRLELADVTTLALAGERIRRGGGDLHSVRHAAAAREDLRRHQAHAQARRPVADAGLRPKQLEYKTGGPSDITRLYTRELLERAFADFSSLDISEHDSVVDEGSGHAGMSALIDLVGRK